MMETKLSISDSMKSGFQLWKKYLSKILVVGLIVYIPAQICIELISVFVGDEFLLDESWDSFRIMSYLYDLIRYIIGSIALLGILNFIVLKLENPDGDEKDQSVKEIIMHGLRKWTNFIGTGIIAGFKILGYMLLLIIPGIYKSVRLSFIDCEVATNDYKVTDPCDVSEQLVEKHWWRVFGFLLSMFLLQFLFELLFIIPLLSFADSHVMSVVLGVIIKLFETYFIVVRASYYFRLKQIRKNNLAANQIKNETKDTEQAAEEITIV